MFPASARALAAILGLTCIIAGTSAHAACTKLGSSVNDYGKIGPARDAQARLDKHIAAWTAAHGIKKYTTGKKTVDCKLFLDFGVFDEYTCRAEATVCWGGPHTADAAVAEPKK